MPVLLYYLEMLQKITSRKIILGIIFIAVVGGGFFVYRKFTKTEALTYTTSEVKKGTLIVSVSGSGSIAAKNTAEVDPGISGEVTKIYVAEGDVVKKGQVLMSIKNDDLAVASATAYTTYLQAQEALEKAKLDKTSAEESLENLQEEDEDDSDSVSDLQIDITEQAVKDAELAIQAAEDKVTSTSLAYEAAKSDLGIKTAEQAVRNADLAIKSAEDKISSTKLSYEEAKKEADKRQVKAPIAGTVTSLDVSIGDELEGKTSSGTTSSSSLLTIVNLSNLVAQVDINEVDALNVKKEQKATLTFDVFSEDKKFTGKVSKVDTLGTTTQGVTTYQVEITLDSMESTIKPGMTVSADIITESKDNVLLVANSAIKTSGEQNYVQVLPESGVPQNVTVEIGLTSNQETEIVSGLSEEDKVITATSTQGTNSASFGGGLQGIIQGGGSREVFFSPGGEVKGVMR